jgi:hypothetical protein
MSILKTLIYSILFLFISPGFIFNLYPKTNGYLLSQETSYIAIFIHTLLLTFIIVALEDKQILEIKDNSIKTHFNRVESKELIPIVCIILFIFLSPGLIFTIPPGENGLFFSKETSHLAVILHALIFIAFFGISVDLIDRNRELLKI